MNNEEISAIVCIIHGLAILLFWSGVLMILAVLAVLVYTQPWTLLIPVASYLVGKWWFA
jgi:hypothetical protein